MNDTDRYNRAAHAMQAGVKLDSVSTNEHPQLRIGINVAMRDFGSLCGLLVAKGVITLAEYAKALADGMEEEVRMYEDKLSSDGTRITLVGKFGSIHDDEVAS